MANREKALKRERTRLLKSQHPQQIDFRRMRQTRTARRLYWKTKTKPATALVEKITPTSKDEKKPKKEKKPKEEKAPELEIVEDEPELEIPEVEEIADVRDDLYTYDEEIEE